LKFHDVVDAAAECDVFAALVDAFSNVHEVDEERPLTDALSDNSMEFLTSLGRVFSDWGTVAATASAVAAGFAFLAERAARRSNAERKTVVGRLVYVALRRRTSVVPSTTDEEPLVMRFYEPKVRYRYVVDGVEHKGHRVAVAYFESQNLAPVLAVFEKLRRGGSVVVRYLPDDPSDSCLAPNPRRTLCFAAALSFFIPIAALLVFSKFAYEGDAAILLELAAK
jgi:hypothetical protein